MRGGWGKGWLGECAPGSRAGGIVVKGEDAVGVGRSGCVGVWGCHPPYTGGGYAIFFSGMGTCSKLGGTGVALG
jgi:hypothetical protein